MEKIMQLLSWVKARLTEPSSLTWIIVVLGYFGYTMDPELLNYIVGIVVSLIGVIQFSKKDTNTLIKEDTKKVEKEIKEDTEHLGND